MNYKVFFTTGQYIVITQKDYNSLIDILSNNQLNDKVVVITENKTLFFIKHVSHITPESESTSGVVKPPTPQSLKDDAKKREEEIQRNPDKLLERLNKNEE